MAEKTAMTSETNVIQLTQDQKIKVAVRRKPDDLKWLHKDILETDGRYQRTTENQKLIAEIRANFDWFALGTLHVSFREDKYWVVDGGHRLRGAAGRPDVSLIPCLVFRFESVVEEAMAFLAINEGRSPVKPVDRFRAALTAEDKHCVSLNAFLKEAGYKVAKELAPKNIQAVSSLLSLWKANQEVFKRTWEIVVAMPDEENRFCPSIFRTVFAIGKKEIIGDEYKANLQKLGAIEARQKMKEMCIRSGKSGIPFWMAALEKACKPKKQNKPKEPIISQSLSPAA